MSATFEKDFVEQYNPVDRVESSYNASLQTYDFSDEEKYSLADLRGVADRWLLQSRIDIRSQRSQLACLDIARRAMFEAASRHGRVAIFAAAMSGETMPSIEETLVAFENEEIGL